MANMTFIHMTKTYCNPFNVPVLNIYPPPCYYVVVVFISSNCTMA